MIIILKPLEAPMIIILTLLMIIILTLLMIIILTVENIYSTGVTYNRPNIFLVLATVGSMSPEYDLQLLIG